MKRILIQPSPLPDQTDLLPWIIRENGDVEQQHIWKGNPIALVGFQKRLDVKELNLPFENWWADPQQAVNMYPVFLDASNPDEDSHTYYVHRVAIEVVCEIPELLPCRLGTVPDAHGSGFHASCLTHSCVQLNSHYGDPIVALREFECDKGGQWRFIVETDPEDPPSLVDLSRLKSIVRSAQEQAAYDTGTRLRIWRWLGDGAIEELLVAHVPGTGGWVETTDRGDHHDRGPMAYPQFTVTGPDGTEYTRVTVTVDGAA